MVLVYVGLKEVSWDIVIIRLWFCLKLTFRRYNCQGCASICRGTKHRLLFF